MHFHELFPVHFLYGHTHVSFKTHGLEEGVDVQVQRSFRNFASHASVTLPTDGGLQIGNN